MNGKILAPVRVNNPVNLLDNAYFEVAQAGRNGLHGSRKYVCDRWISWNADAAFNSGFITPASPIDQRIIPDKIDTTQTYTVGIGLADGRIIVNSGKFPTGAGLFATVWFGERDGISFVRVGENQNVCWVALYPGAYTADTFPTPVPRLNSTELLECQRYFYSFKTGSGSFNGYYSSSTVARVMFNLPVKMRTTPTVFADLALGNIFPENIVPKELRGAYMTGNMLVCELGVTGGTVRNLICWKPNCDISFVSDL